MEEFIIEIYRMHAIIRLVNLVYNGYIRLSSEFPDAFATGNLILRARSFLLAITSSQ